MPNVAFGTAWLDYNDDGLADLYVGKHLDGSAPGREPNLWVNQGDGTFVDQFATAFPEGIGGDTHGNGWIDFDNDGDPDLFQVTGAQGGTGTGSNWFYVNSGGVFTEQAVPRGLELPLGRARDDFWFDWNADGLLDVLIANDKRPDGQQPSVLMQQQSDGTFFDATAAAGLDFSGVNADSFRVGDVNNDGLTDIVLLLSSQPLKFYAGQPSGGFAEVSGYIPSANNIQEFVIGDFNNDGYNDAFVARANLSAGIVELLPDNTISSVLRTRTTEMGFRFKTTGDITFDFRDEQINDGRAAPQKMYIGSQGNHPAALPFTLSPTDVGIEGLAPHAAGQGDGLYIGYDAVTETWEVQYSDPSYARIDFVVESTAAITDLSKVNFISFDNTPLPDQLLIFNPQTGQLEDQLVAAGLGSPTAATSVVAADFDNDTDLDLYLGAELSAAGLVDLYYENQGNGTFVVETVEATRLPSEGLPGDPLASQGGPHVAHFGDGSKVLLADYNNDGFVDIYFNGTQFPASLGDMAGTPSSLLQNQANGNHWLALDLRGVQSNRDGIGATVTVSAGGVTQTRTQWGGQHRMGQDFMRLQFGLGASSTVDEVTIRWPSGELQTLQGIAANQVLQVAEPPGDVLYRINTGGISLPGVPIWETDNNATPSPYLSNTSNNTAISGTDLAINISDPSIPAGTPMAVFQTERFDKPFGGEMEYQFPVAPGDYEVRLYFAETWSGAAPGIRIFDVAIEGVTRLDDYDVFADVGGYAGVVKSFSIASDDVLDIKFLHVTQNPAVKGIEIVRNSSSEFSLLTSSADTVDFGAVALGQTRERNGHADQQQCRGRGEHYDRSCGGHGQRAIRVRFRPDRPDRVGPGRNV